VPEPPDLTDIHRSLLAAVQAHPTTAETFTLQSPPATPSVWSRGERSNRHGAGSWCRAIGSSFTTRLPWRAIASGLAATVKSTFPVPWPEAGVSPVIQPTEDFAVHAHSLCAVTVMVPFPPAEPIESDDRAVVSWHLSGVGPVLVVEEAPHA